MDAITLIMFIMPMLVAVIFTLLGISAFSSEKKRFSLIDFMSNLIAAISWSLFGLTWAISTTDATYLSVSYLWYGFGLIFGVLTIYVAFRMVGAIFETKTVPMLQIQNNDEPEED